MTLFNAANANPQQMISQVQMALVQIRSAMETAQELGGWGAATALADLTAQPPDGPGMPTADAQAILSACADAEGLSLLYNTGTDPRDVSPGYVYGASQKIVIGPRTV
jgi:hypothetical protein